MFYYFFLRKTTFFRANRYYLLGSLIISLVIPFIKFKAGQLPGIIHQPVIQSASFNYIADDFLFEEFKHQQINAFRIVTSIYFLGTILMLCRMFILLFNLFRLVIVNQTLRNGRNLLVFIDNCLMPFSFFHYIFIDKTCLSAKISAELEHERVHTLEYHSFDVLFTELVSAFLWFNPFIFFLRSSIKENHEYIADAKVIQSGIHPVDYLTILANGVFRNHQIGLTSNFKSSITKKRLIMITKINSSKKTRFRFLFILPLIALLFLAFSKSEIPKSAIVNGIQSKTNDSVLENTPSILPLIASDVSMTSGYGWRIHPKYKIKKFHKGIDFKAPEGSEIYATACGVIELMDNKEKEEGKYLVIRHNGQYQTLYSHLSAFTVKLNDQVTKGQLIGYVGNTGYSTGSHLHYEVIKNGKNVDPIDYIHEIK